MKCFIGCKIIRAEQMSEIEFLEKYRSSIPDGLADTLGYHVLYPDGYHSWSPKAVFESAYREITLGEFELINPSETPERSSKDD